MVELDSPNATRYNQLLYASCLKYKPSILLSYVFDAHINTLPQNISRLPLFLNTMLYLRFSECKRFSFLSTSPIKHLCPMQFPKCNQSQTRNNFLYLIVTYIPSIAFPSFRFIWKPKKFIFYQNNFHQIIISDKLFQNQVKFVEDSPLKNEEICCALSGKICGRQPSKNLSGYSLL